MAALNQHSFIAVGIALLGVVWFLTRNRGRWLRRSALLATVGLLALVGLGLRTGAGSGAAALDAALADGDPVLLHFYSDL